MHLCPIYLNEAAPKPYIKGEERQISKNPDRKKIVEMTHLVLYDHGTLS